MVQARNIPPPAAGSSRRVAALRGPVPPALRPPLPYRVSMRAVGIWLVLVILGAVLATEAAATRASRLTVREALAYI